MPTNLETLEIKDLTSESDRAKVVEIAGSLIEYIKRTNSYSIGAKHLGYDLPAFAIYPNFFYIYPRILMLGDTRRKMTEYCSLTRTSIDIVRPSQVLVGFTTWQGERVVKDLSGIEARYFQHECDKLVGIDFRTKATPREQIKAVKRVLH